MCSGGTTAWANIGVSKDNKEVLLVPIQDGKDTLALIETQDVEIQLLWDSIRKKDVQIDKLAELVITANENKMIAEEKQLEAESKLKKEKSKRWGIGIFGGVNYYGEAVVGVGLSYNIIKF